jgi:hypothetical protein
MIHDMSQLLQLGQIRSMGQQKLLDHLADLVDLFRPKFPRRGCLCHVSDIKTRTCQFFSNQAQSRNPFLVPEIPTVELHDGTEMAERPPHIIDQSYTL